MPDINQQIESFINKFAKQNKVGRAKVQSLLDNIQALKPARQQRKPQALSETSTKIQDHLMDIRGNGAPWTAKDISTILGVSQTDVNNGIKRLEKQGYTFSKIPGEKIPGKRGRVPTMYIFCK